jgi:(2Fe-2S) ferredoxin
MNSPDDDRTSQFTLEGQFLAFVVEQNKVKHLRMVVAEEELQIKLSKQARASLFALVAHNPVTFLRPWDRIQVTGRKKYDRQTGLFKLKADHIGRAGVAASLPCEMQPIEPQFAPSNSPPTCAKTCPKLKLLLCQKSGCQKRGGKQQQQLLEAILHDRGLQQQIKIERTGCLGKCSHAPNVVLMPGKKRLSGMKPEAIVDLLENLNLNQRSFITLGRGKDELTW